VAIISATGTGNPAAHERLEGYLAALAEHGIDAPRRWIADAGWTREDGRGAMRRILDAPGPPPTAVLCSNDWQALGAMDEARARGLDVPADISVVGFDGCDAALRGSSPSIATVEHDLDSIGRATARALLDWIEGRVDAPPTVRIPARFRPGGSLAAPRGEGPWRRGDHERA
jgi:LacI family transcriptional regulator